MAATEAHTAAAPDAVDAGQARADEAQAALVTARARVSDLEAKQKRNATEKEMLTMLNASMHVMEAGQDACMLGLAKAKAAAGKGCKQSTKPAAKRGKS